jgi:hypothetical protein
MDGSLVEESVRAATASLQRVSASLDVAYERLRALRQTLASLERIVRTVDMLPPAPTNYTPNAPHLIANDIRDVATPTPTSRPSVTSPVIDIRVPVGIAPNHAALELVAENLRTGSPSDWHPLHSPPTQNHDPNGEYLLPDNFVQMPSIHEHREGPNAEWGNADRTLLRGVASALAPAPAQAGIHADSDQTSERARVHDALTRSPRTQQEMEERFQAMQAELAARRQAATRPSGGAPGTPSRPASRITVFANPPASPVPLNTTSPVLVQYPDGTVVVHSTPPSGFGMRTVGSNPASDPAVAPWRYVPPRRDDGDATTSRGHRFEALQTVLERERERERTAQSGNAGANANTVTTGNVTSPATTPITLRTARGRLSEDGRSFVFEAADGIQPAPLRPSFTPPPEFVAVRVPDVELSGSPSTSDNTYISTTPGPSGTRGNDNNGTSEWSSVIPALAATPSPGSRPLADSVSGGSAPHTPSPPFAVSIHPPYVPRAPPGMILWEPWMGITTPPSARLTGNQPENRERDDNRDNTYDGDDLEYLDPIADPSISTAEAVPALVELPEEEHQGAIDDEEQLFRILAGDDVNVDGFLNVGYPPLEDSIQNGPDPSIVNIPTDPPVDARHWDSNNQAGVEEQEPGWTEEIVPNRGYRVRRRVEPDGTETVSMVPMSTTLADLPPIPSGSSTTPIIQEPIPLPTASGSTSTMTQEHEAEDARAWLEPTPDRLQPPSIASMPRIMLDRPNTLNVRGTASPGRTPSPLRRSPTASPMIRETSVGGTPTDIYPRGQPLTLPSTPRSQNITAPHPGRATRTSPGFVYDEYGRATVFNGWETWTSDSPPAHSQPPLQPVAGPSRMTTIARPPTPPDVVYTAPEPPMQRMPTPAEQTLDILRHRQAALTRSTCSHFLHDTYWLTID